VRAEQRCYGADESRPAESLAYEVQQRGVPGKKNEADDAVGNRIESEEGEDRAVEEGAEGPLLFSKRAEPCDVEVHHIVRCEVGCEAVAGEGEEYGGNH